MPSPRSGRSKQQRHARATEPLSADAPKPAWRGQEVRPGPVRSESPEDAAARAEGNARLPVDEALRWVQEAGKQAADTGHATIDDTPDSAENAEEKRIAAAEEHAAEPSRGPGHGKL